MKKLLTILFASACLSACHTDLPLTENEILFGDSLDSVFQVWEEYSEARMNAIPEMLIDTLSVKVCDGDTVLVWEMRCL